MTNSVDLRSRRNNGQRRQPVAISAGIVILAAIALVCAGLVAVPLWTALVQGSQVEAISDPCELKDATTLQDCLEKLRLGGHPAKGANVPIRLHPREQKSD
jgi:acyl-CoA synthetase (AMP-forming)/AMP-acid ligase II